MTSQERKPWSSWNTIEANFVLTFLGNTELSEVERRFGLPTTISRRIKDYLVSSKLEKHLVWACSSQAHSYSNDLNVHLEHICTELEKHKDELAEFLKRGCTAQILISWDCNSYMGIAGWQDIESEIIKRIALLGAEIEFIIGVTSE
jgi:hypothetical protein